MLALSKENGLVWLEAYEKMLNGVLKLEEDTAKDLVPTGSKNLCRRKPTLSVKRHRHTSVQLRID